METELIDLLRTELLPVPYHEFVAADGDMPAMFVRQERKRCHYVLAASNWSTQMPPLAQLGRVRRQIDSWFDASFLRGTGLILLWQGPWADWSGPSELLRPDRHGLRSTIIQGIIFLDPQSGKTHVSQSSWGPIKFGNRSKNFTKILAALEKYGQSRAET